MYSVVECSVQNAENLSVINITACSFQYVHIYRIYKVARV